MEVKISYLVKLDDGKQAWLSVDRKVPEGATIIEERPMLIPSEGMVLHKKNTNEYSSGTWLRDSTIDEWEEVKEEEYDELTK
jgi:hypothetical protein